MILKTIVEHDKSGLEMVLDAMDELKAEKFIEGIKNKHHNAYEIAQTAEMVQIYQHRINIEAKSITRFSERFIRSYATDNNNCFTTAEILFHKIRCTVASLKKVFHKTAPVDYTQLPKGVKPPSSLDKSPLGHGSYQPDIFGIESFSEEVQKLYLAIDTLFTTSTMMLELCHNMIECEENTRNDIDQLRQIYKQSCEELLGAVKTASAFVDSSQDLPENELEKLREKAGSDEDEKFLKPGYHSCNKDDMVQYLIIETIKQARNGGATDIEAFFWKNDHAKALKVRHVVENFDKVAGVRGQANSLSSTVLVEFLKWCGVDQKLEKQLYVKYFMPKYDANGQYELLSWNSISGQRKFLMEVGATDEKLAGDFQLRLHYIPK